MRFVTRAAVALALLTIAVGLSRAQKILEENPYYLRADTRLQVKLNLDSERLKLDQIIASLHEATGLNLTVDPGLRNHQPDFGVIQHSEHGYHAWQLMELVANNDLQHGYWDKTDDGYRLMGISTAPPPKAGPEEGSEMRCAWMAGIAGVNLFLLLAGAVLYRWWIVRKAKLTRCGQDGRTTAAPDASPK